MFTMLLLGMMILSMSGCCGVKGCTTTGCPTVAADPRLCSGSWTAVQCAGNFVLAPGAPPTPCGCKQNWTKGGVFGATGDPVACVCR